jgi:uncharacterized protein
MCSALNQTMYTPHRDWLLRHARHALVYGVKNNRAPVVQLDELPDVLLEERATFITLEKNGNLRGCIGRLEASQPLVIDIAENTVAAALEDPRFPPVKENEIASIAISISILTPPEPMTISTEKELLNSIRPEIDGLILEEGRRRATFLPSVWDELKQPRDFIAHLKQKAGWPANYWSDQIRAYRYQTIYLSEKD